MVAICTTSLTFNNSTFRPHNWFKCFVWISEQTAIISLYNINWLVFTGVYCAVRTGSSSRCIWRQSVKWTTSCVEFTLKGWIMLLLRTAQSINYPPILMPSRTLHRNAPFRLTSVSWFHFSYLSEGLDFAVFVPRELTAWSAAALVMATALYCVWVPADLLYLMYNCNIKVVTWFRRMWA